MMYRMLLNFTDRLSVAADLRGSSASKHRLNAPSFGPSSGQASSTCMASFACMIVEPAYLWLCRRMLPTDLLRIRVRRLE